MTPGAGGGRALRTGLQTGERGPEASRASSSEDLGPPELL